MSWFGKSEEEVLVDNLLDKIESKIMTDTSEWTMKDGFHNYKNIFYFADGFVTWDRKTGTKLLITKKQAKRLIGLETKLNAYKLMDGIK